MSDRSELALQLTDAVAAAYHAIERAGNRAYKSFGLSQRAHAAMQALLFGPLGMKSTTFDYAKVMKGNHAMPHGDALDGSTRPAS